ncbi:TonB-dependent receptor [Porticoccus sp. GXU_MW_L64]
MVGGVTKTLFKPEVNWSKKKSAGLLAGFLFWASSCLPALASEANGSGDGTDQTVYQINIPSQNAADALNRLAEQTGATFLYLYDVAAGQQANEVVGRYRVLDALNQLLANTGLTSGLSKRGSIRIFLSDGDQNTREDKPVTFKRRSLWAAIAAVLVGSGNSVQAQAAEGENAKDAKTEIAEEVVITGIRGSLKHAQDLKRDADSIIEAVTLEDLGKFPDTNLADALQRVPGVQIQRNDNGATDGGDRVSIRGLGPQFVQTTINGRTPLSAGSGGGNNLREYNFDTLPTEVISGLVVYKSPEADLVESGLGGSVDVQTLRPLDTGMPRGQNFRGSVNLRTTYNDESEDFGPRISAVGIFKNDERNFGASLAVLSSEFENSVDETFYRTLTTNTTNRTINIDGDVQEGGVVIPQSITNNPIESEQKRTAIATTVQFRNDSGLEINGDLLYAEYDLPSVRNLFRIVTTAQRGIFDGVSAPGSVTIEDGQLQFFDGRQNADDGDSLQLQTQHLDFDNKTENLIGGLNVAWSNDDWRIAGDVSYSELTFENVLRVLGNFQAREGGFGSGQPVTGLGDFVFDDLTADAAGFIFSDEAAAGALDPASYRALAGVVNNTQNESDRTAFRLDVERQLEGSTKLQFGLRYEQTEIDFRQAGAAVSTPDGVTEADIRAAGLTGGAQDTFLSGIFPAGSFDTFPVVDGEAVAALIPDLNQRVFGTSVFEIDDIVAAAGSAEGTSISPNAANFFNTEEDTFAAYAQVDWEGNLGDAVPFTANFGVRAVQTKVTTTAFSGVRIAGRGQDVDDIDGDGNTTEPLPAVNASFVPTVAESDDWEVLPSFNINFSLSEETKLRVGLSKVLTRPTYRDQVPNNNIVIDLTEETVTASGGNGELSPYTAEALDVVLEHYTPNGGAVYLSAFYKEVEDFIIRQPREGALVALPFDPVNGAAIANDIQLGVDNPIPAGQSGLFETVSATTPVNVSDGKVKGFEVGFNQPLTFLPEFFHNFGVNANYTYIDSSFGEDVGDAGLGFPGSSEDNVNLVAYYEVDNFSTRLAYTYRGEYLRNLAGVGDRMDAAIFTEAQEQLNLNFSYRPVKGLSLSLALINLTGEDRRDFRGVNSNFQAYVTRPKQAIFGVRYSF